ncbi:hypothetical protein [Mycolicibacterium llatzerense]|uniref:hypothetical protein n=1 Tax=Mycolicibacterium llatzerense TaxID=280871 RepID=UPI0008DCBA75|nr:hypothetical protein [Mycolicibacterium llatzerense]
MLSHLPQFVNPSASGADFPLRRRHVVHTLTNHHSHGGGIWTLFLVMIVIAVIIAVAVVLYRKSQSRAAQNSMAAYTPAVAPWQSGAAVGAPWQSGGAQPSAAPYTAPAYPSATWNAAPMAPAWPGAQPSGWAAPALR